MTLNWTPEPLDQALARQLRRDIRAHRRTRGRGGHRYVLKDLRELWVGRELGEVRYVLAQHHGDPVWQVWGWHLTDGWHLIDWSEALTVAQDIATNHSWPEPDPDLPEEPGTYVVAGWAPEDPDQQPSFTMRVRCSTKNTAIAVSEVLHKLGCTTEREVRGG